jgi:hypothetical protein
VEELLYTYKLHKPGGAEKLMKEVSRLNLSEEEKKLIIQKVDIGLRRIAEPLEWTLILYYVLFPFGPASALYDSTDEIDRFYKYGYIKKQRQALTISLCTILLYIVIFSICLFL